MKDRVKKAQPATRGQLLEIGNTISEKVVELLAERGFSFDQAKFAIESVGKTKITDLTEHLAAGIFELAPADPTAHYKKDLSIFFSEVYGINLDLSAMVFPHREGFDHYMVKPTELDSDSIYAGFEKVNVSSSKYVAESIAQNKKTEAARPSTLYGFAHRGGAERDREHVDKSYNDFITESASYMTIDEYMLVFQFMYWRFRTYLDEKGWTRTSTLDQGGDVMSGDWFNGGFKLRNDNRAWRHSGGGPRSIVLA